MEKQKNFKIGLYSLIAIVLIVLFSLLSFLAYEAVLLNKNLEKANAAKEVKNTYSPVVPVEPEEDVEEDFIDVPEEVNVDEDTSTVTTSTTKTEEDTDKEEPVSTTTTDVEEVDEETIKTLVRNYYLDRYSSPEVEEYSRITDCEVTLVDVLTGESKAEIIKLDNGKYYLPSDTLAYIRYSIKPVNINNCDYWYAGKEPYKDGEWLREKSQCIYIRDGVVTVVGTSF